jgi:hypothetical protein
VNEARSGRLVRGVRSSLRRAGDSRSVARRMRGWRLTAHHRAMCRIPRVLPLVMLALSAIVLMLGVTHREISATLAGLATMTAILLISWSTGRTRHERASSDGD